LLLLLLFASCAPPVQDGGGNVRILLDGSGARYAVRDEDKADFIYILDFSGPGGESHHVETQPGATSVTLSLTPGEWNVHVDAWYEGFIFGDGEERFPVYAGRGNSVSISMSPLSGNSFVSGLIYTVTFDLNGGTGAVPEQYVEGTDGTGTITEPGSRPRSTAAGEVFAGWYTDNVLYTTKWDFAAMTLSAITDNVNHAMTLYAKWEADSYAADDFGAAALIDDAFTVTDKPAWNAAIAAISNGGNDKNYIITLGGSFSIDGLPSGEWSFGTDTVTGVTVSLRGAYTLDLGGTTGSLLRISDNKTLILRGLILQGHTSNTQPLVFVNGSSASLAMKGEAKILGNKGSAASGGGVAVYYGDFTMEDGEISGNTGSGVYVSGSSFTMEDGVISGNSTDYYGGGVCIHDGGSFTMEDGVISGNSGGTGGGGGGVAVYDGSFTMEGGVISGNSSYYGGGGVLVLGDGSFTKTGGGIIYGDLDGTVGNGDPEDNTAKFGNTTWGHAVFYTHVFNDNGTNTSTEYYRDGTLYAADNISTTDELPTGSAELNNWKKQ
jgi:uncharacterized repeat protein (TIGR02543 family)